jgi:ABC-2 type transport system ATP-binding protein
MTITDHALSLRDVGKDYRGTAVLDGLDLDVAPGTVLALLGPNGAGKTTLVSILSTLVRPDRGRATVLGHDVVREARRVRSLISVTGQSATVDDTLTADENLRMMGELLGLGRRGSRIRSEELLSGFDLERVASTRVGTFSGGMRRRLDLAIGLLVERPVVFLDEPTTGLDTRSRQDLWSVIAELAESGTTVLLTTQYLEEADRLADRVALLDGGRIVADGSPHDLKSRVGGDVVTVSAPDGTVLLEVPADDTAAGLRAALDQVERSGIEGTIGLRRPTLDDAFLALTGAEPASASAAGAEPVAAMTTQA